MPASCSKRRCSHPLQRYTLDAPTAEQAAALLVSLKAGSGDAADEIARRHFGLVFHTVRSRFPSMDEDAVAAGMLGLAFGIEKARQPDVKIIALGSFLSFYINHHICKTVRDLIDRERTTGYEAVDKWPVTHFDASDFEFEDIIKTVTQDENDLDLLRLRRQGLSLREIETRTGCSKTVLGETLQMLQRKLEKHFYVD